MLLFELVCFRLKLLGLNHTFMMDPSTSGTMSNTFFISRQELFAIMKNSGHSNFEEQFTFLTENMKGRTGCSEDNLKDLLKKLSYFKSDLKSRWTSARRTEDRFLKANRSWLESAISFPRYESHSVEQNRGGRPKKSFEESGDRSKRKKTEQLRSIATVSELSYAAQISLRASGKTDASKVVHEVTATSPTRASKYRKAYKELLKDRGPRLMTGEDALAVLVEAKLSRHQYNVIRMSDPEKFPSYKNVQEAKKLCYPNADAIKISETSAEVKLQALLDHTVQRLLIVQESVIDSLSEEELNQLSLFTKWGFDGSSGHSSYKQAFHGSEASDAAIFITSIVPIRLVCKSKVIWQNPRPSSPRYCRPLKIQFIKESVEVSITQKNEVDDEIRKLHSSVLIFNQRQVKVMHSLIFAMVDGKVCNALSETTSTQKCYICGATSRDFNRIDEMITKTVKVENLQFGLSVLHGWIRFFECLLHVAYKLPIQKWQARGPGDKDIVNKTKLEIQKMFKERTGLIVDKPKPGFGNSNDGNTARRFFADPELSSEITKIDIDLIKKMHIILIVVSSGHEINVEKFRLFALSTARHFVEKYPWYPMPPTLHKFLIHGPEIISAALLPIGQLTEEAQEARNKDFKMYREHFSRKCSREKSNQDIFNLFLISSDPVITSKRRLPKKKIQNLPQEAIQLLIAPNDACSVGSDYEEDPSSESENENF
ncbi:uncharacterized protein LOC115890777 [Sitophilus oryzae]|uniref:Uncharacterized protein LOC115890777 n=1 Tax=Sitophilus oryzae TaxID=7048 RepID=A0A6J2YUV8_SITOR|nr:uncharacterized protein LOC115890777 [Sitophilus oryzae]